MIKAVTASCALFVLVGAGAPESPRRHVPDRTSALLGSWSCSTEQNSASTLTIVRANGGSIAITNEVTVPGATSATSATIRETYVYHAEASRWAVTTAPDPSFDFGTYTATAKPWTGRRWVFDGSEMRREADGVERAAPVRMIYTALFPAGFRREFQMRAEGIWRDFSEEVCIR